jgi:hypothetical protein
LDLSKDALLSVAIEDSEIELEQDYPGTYARSFTLLLAQSYRWKELRLRLAPSIWPAELLMPGLPLPNLESLDINLDIQEPDDVEDIDCPFQQAQRLKSISLRNAMRVGLALDIPWNQVTYFSSQGYDSDSFISTLADLCPRIIDASIAHMTARREDVQDDELDGPVTCQTLSSLDIQIGQDDDDDVTGAERLFEILVAPSLSSITLSSNDEDSDSNNVVYANSVIIKLSECVRCSECRQTNLTLKNVNFNFISGDTLSNLFSLAPSIENLTLDDRKSISSFVEEEWVRKLDCNYEGPGSRSSGLNSLTPFLPSLQHLVLRTQSVAVNVVTLVNVVRSRWQPFEEGGHRMVASLSSVEFVLERRHVERSLVEALYRMASAGLRITLLDCDGIVI